MLEDVPAQGHRRQPRGPVIAVGLEPLRLGPAGRLARSGGPRQRALVIRVEGERDRARDAGAKVGGERLGRVGQFDLRLLSAPLAGQRLLVVDADAGIDRPGHPHSHADVIPGDEFGRRRVLGRVHHAAGRRFSRGEDTYARGDWLEQFLQTGRQLGRGLRLFHGRDTVDGE